MVKKFSYFIENKTVPDLRKMPKYLKCINGIPRMGFTKGEIYEIIKMEGDPQRAIEDFNINDYIPIECVSVIYVKNNKNDLVRFKVNTKYYSHFMSPKWDDYFDIYEASDNIEKYNL